MKRRELRSLLFVPSPPGSRRRKKKPLDTLTPSELGVDVTPRVRTLKVAEPAARTAGIKVPDVPTVIHKLKNEAKVL